MGSTVQPNELESWQAYLHKWDKCPVCNCCGDELYEEDETCAGCQLDQETIK